MRLSLPASLLLRNSALAHQGVRIVRSPVASNNYSVSALISGSRGDNNNATHAQKTQYKTSPLKILRNVVLSNNQNGVGSRPFNFSQVRLFQTGLSRRSEPEEDQGGTPKRFWRLPPLTDFQPLIWPKFTNSIRNWFLTYFVVKPYFDKDFSMHEFMKGAHKAAALVSTKLSEGEFDALEGLVEPVVLNELRQSISQFSVQQQDLLRVATEDIFFSFPYQVGVIIPDPPPEQNLDNTDSATKIPQVRHVEITVVLHVLRGMAEQQKKSEDTGFSVADFTKDEENKYRVMVCNYRFFRDFTEGCKDPSWIINMVNHFLPAEVVAQR